MNRLNKLDNNVRYQRLIRLELIVADRNLRDSHISVLNRIIDNYIIKDKERPKSQFHKRFYQES